jgi:hypothetical protein
MFAARRGVTGREGNGEKEKVEKMEREEVKKK